MVGEEPEVRAVVTTFELVPPDESLKPAIIPAIIATIKTIANSFSGESKFRFLRIESPLSFMLIILSVLGEWFKSEELI